MLPRFRSRWVLAIVAPLALVVACGAEPPEKARALVGAYYFDGWAGHGASAVDAPTHLTQRMLEEFPGREPVWGWRDDSPEVMERQIDLAADHGVAFFAFCWYWHDNDKAINPKAIRDDPLHTGLALFLKARNRHRMKFCLLVANHGGSQILGTEAWKQAADFWMPYLKDPQYLTTGGKPLLLVFDAAGGDKAGFAGLQEAARAAGLTGVAIAGCGAGDLETGYTHRTHYCIRSGGPSPESREHHYAELLPLHRKAWYGKREQPYIPAVTAGWDRRPWEGPAGWHGGVPVNWYYPDRTPEQFAALLSEAISWMDQHPEQTTAERLVLVYAWNEFGEGGYIAPTKADPEGRYLKALRAVVMEPGRKP